MVILVGNAITSKAGAVCMTFGWEWWKFMVVFKAV
jgi:hypothetical protein